MKLFRFSVFLVIFVLSKLLREMNPIGIILRVILLAHLAGLLFLALTCLKTL